MVGVDSYPVAVILCFVTMLCWGSWANTQKLSSKDWKFQLFYWDYSVGVLLLTVIFALTLGTFGTEGPGFLQNLGEADSGYLLSAFVGGVVFNLANILLVAAIDIAGMAVAFPVGIGLALVLGVIINYAGDPSGNPLLLFAGVGAVTIAIILNAIAYKKLSTKTANPTAKGIGLSVACGVIMAMFYRFVARSIPPNLGALETEGAGGMLTPYTALVMFAVGLFVSNFVFNSFIMKKPFAGEAVAFRDYFAKGTPRLHLIGIVGGVIWSVGMSLSILAGDKASYAISYGLGQCATMVAALWGVFIWKEFTKAPRGTNKYLALMFILFLAGIALIIAAKT